MSLAGEISSLKHGQFQQMNVDTIPTLSWPARQIQHDEVRTSVYGMGSEEGDSQGLFKFAHFPIVLSRGMNF